MNLSTETRENGKELHLIKDINERYEKDLNS